MGSWVPRCYALRRSPRLVQFSLQIPSFVHPKYGIFWRPQPSTFSPSIEAVRNCAPCFSSSSRSQELARPTKATKKTLQGDRNTNGGARKKLICVKADEGQVCAKVDVNVKPAGISLFEDVEPTIKGSGKKTNTKVVEAVGDDSVLQTVNPGARKASPIKAARNHARGIAGSEEATCGSARKASLSKTSRRPVQGIVVSKDVCKVLSSSLLSTSEPVVRRAARKASCLNTSTNDVRRMVGGSEDVSDVPSSYLLPSSQPARKGARKVAHSKASMVSECTTDISSLSSFQCSQPGRGTAKKTSRLKTSVDEIKAHADSQKIVIDESNAPNSSSRQGEPSSKVAKKKSSKRVREKEVKDSENSADSMRLASKNGEKSSGNIHGGLGHRDLSRALNDESKIYSINEQSKTTAIMYNSSQNAQFDTIRARNTTIVKVCRDALTDFHKINEDETNSIELPLLEEAQPGTAGTAIKESNIKNRDEEVAGLMPITLEDNVGAGITSTMKTHVAERDLSCVENNEKTQMSDSKQSIDHVEQESCRTKCIDNIKISKRSKKNPEEIASLLRLHTCSKYGDLHGALKLYDDLKREGIVKLNLSYYSSLLYICSGAASGTLTIAKSGREKRPESISPHDGNRSACPSGSSSQEINEVISFSAADKELAVKRGKEIYEDMLNLHIPLSEAIFTSLCRLAVAKGDGDLAFDIVKQMISQGISPKLRSYGPALLCFCENNDIHKAFEVDRHMAEAGVLPDENTLDNLLRVSIQAGQEDKVYSLLHRLRKTVRDLAPSTVRSIEKWFNSDSAASAGGLKPNNFPLEDIRQAIEANGGGWHGLGWLGEGKWEVKRTRISKTGLCSSCGEKLCTIDLDPRETSQFADSIAGFACEREHLSNQFREFQEWLDKNGPYGAILDGANIGLYNPQVFRGFSFKLLANVMRKANATISSQRPPLILLHNRHSTRIAKTPSDEGILNRWKKENSLYFTPQGSNDDWYWLYAAVKCKCLLVTNDEMRDHIFELLGTDFFPKWKERHQVRFSFSPKGLELHMPPPYSIVIQESQHGSWHIPQAGGDDIDIPREWLCVTRPSYNVSDVLHASHS